MKKYEALVSKVFYFLRSTAILGMLGVMSLVSSTIPLPRNHAAVCAAAYELVVMARSTRMLVFILFHLFVVMISCGSSSEPDFDSELLVDDLGNKEEGEACAYGYEEIDDVLYEGDDEYDDDEEEEHGDLRGRIEEFIGSVTRTWKEELLKEKKLLCLVEDTESLYILVPCEKWCS